jgi:hypothetical protein
VQTQDYAHQEIQTWTINGTPTLSGAISVYPASWTVSGQGGLQRQQGTQILAARWNSNVPGINAPLAIFVRASDQRLVIKSYHAQVVAPNATNGVRQVNGAQTNLNYAAWEWTFPTIEADGNSQTVVGSGTVVIAGTYMPLQAATASSVANCKWQFNKGSTETVQRQPPVIASGSGTLPITNAPIISPRPESPTNSDIASSTATNSAAAVNPSAMPISQSPQAASNPVAKALATLPAPTGFTAKHLGNGTVQFTWNPVPGAAKYRIEGTGISSSGLFVSAPVQLAGSNNAGGQVVAPPPPVVQNVPPGVDTWQIAAVNSVGRWDQKAEATASAIVRYPPAHSPPWLSKANGAGNPGSTISHYLSLCSQCVVGANFKDVLLNLGLSLDPLGTFPDAGPGCGDYPWCGDFGSIWVDDQAARYTNVTEFSNSTRETACWNIGRPNGRIVCYTKTLDHGLQVIVKQTDYSWFLSFTGDQNEDVLDWVAYDADVLARIPPGQRLKSSFTLSATGVTFDSEGAKFPPHACLACHGGKFTANGVTGATLLPLDPGLIKPATITIGYNDYGYDANNVRKVNQAVMNAGPSAAVARYLNGLYGIDPRVATTTGDPNYVPQGWKQQPEVYKNVVKPYCMMCHLGTPSNLDFTIPGNFFQNKELVYTTVCSAHSMPHAESPYVTLWSKDTGPVFLPGYLAGILGHQSCP